MDNQPTSLTSGGASAGATYGTTVATYGDGGYEDRLQSIQAPDDNNDGSNEADEGTTSSMDYDHDYGTAHPDSAVSQNPTGGDYLPSSSVDGNGNCTSYYYDAAGRLLHTYIEQDPTHLSAEYDAISCSGSTSGKHYQQAYNAADGTIKHRQDPNSGDTDDKRTVLQYWAPSDSGYVTGTQGQLKNEIRPGGDCSAGAARRLCTSYTYDQHARVASKTDGRGVTTTYKYDDMDRTTQVRNDGLSTACTPVETAAGVCVTYGYDAEGNLQTRTDVNGETTFVYDQLNRQRAVTTNDTLAASVTEVAYDYNDDGKLTELAQSENTSVVNQVGYDYDDANYPAKATVNSEAATAADKLVVTLDQNNDGKHNQTVFTDMSTPIEIKKDYTNAGRLKQIDVREQATTGNKRATLDYSHQLGGVDTNMLRSVTIGGTGSAGINGTMSYSYLNDNRKLASVTQPGDDYDYTFDDAGNVREEKKGSTRTFYGYDRAGQLCWEDSTDHTGAGLVNNCQDPTTTPGTDYDQDAAGNSLGTSADPYGYNDFDQVDSIDGVDQTYRDLGNDLRIGNGDHTLANSSVGVISRTDASGPSPQTTYYLYDPDGGILAAYPAMDTSGYQDDAVYYVTNHQKSVVMLLDADGNRVGWYRYSPYGDPTIVDQTAGAATENPWRYLSAYYSPENGGYHHLGARMYDNQSHFTQPDPERGDLADPLQTLAYGYAHGDSVNQADPSGRSCKYSGDCDDLGGEMSWKEIPVVAGYIGACAGGAELSTATLGGFIPLLGFLGPEAIAAGAVVVPVGGCIAGAALAYNELDSVLDVPIGE